MTKQPGLGDNLYVDGINVSGDTGSLSRIGGGPAALDLTGIDKFAPERKGGLLDGSIDWSAWFSPTSTHPELSKMPRENRVVSYFRGTELGGEAACLIAKQVNYNPTRGNDGSLSIAVSTTANGFGLEWTNQLTGGIVTHDAPAGGAGVDLADDTDFGLQAYVHVLGLDGDDVTISIEHSDDDGDLDAYVSLIAFPEMTGIGSARVQTARDLTVKRWIRYAITGTFADVALAVSASKNVTRVDF